MCSQFGREKRCDKSFQNFRRAFSSDLTDCPWVSEDDSRDDTLYRVPSKSTGHFQIQRIRCRVGLHYGTGLETPPITFNSKDLKPGGGGTPLQEVNRDVPLDGIAFSRLE